MCFSPRPLQAAAAATSFSPRRKRLCENPALSPLGERVARDGVFISRRGSGEGVPTWIDYLIL
jgi:hypothetical protein